MASELKVNKITPESGVTLTLGDSGDTINFGSGVLPNFENLTVTGDLTVDTNSLKVDSTNNRVGIGTASPSVALDVVGGASFTDNVDLGDNDRLRFGASQDLEIWHDGFNSYIRDSGTGNLVIKGSNTIELESTLGEKYAKLNNNGSVDLYYDNSKKFETTSTGIDVTGSVVSDGATIVNSSGATLDINTNASGVDAKIILHEGTTASPANGATLRYDGANNQFYIGVGTSVDTKRLNIDRDTGDISFYEDTGTTPKFFWDASAESLGIGTSSPTHELTLSKSATAINNDPTFQIINTWTGEGNNVGFSNRALTLLEAGNGTVKTFIQSRYDSGANLGEIGTSTSHDFRFLTGNTERMRIDSSGILKIGTSGTATPYVHSKFAIDTGLYSYMDLISTGSSGINFGDASLSQVGSIEYNHSSNYLRFITNAGEKMRIDNSGNLFVGKTSLSYTTVGHELKAEGRAFHTADGGKALTLTRLTSNGGILDFYNASGQEIGTIGIISNDNLYIVNPHSNTQKGIGIADDNIYPVDNTGNSTSNQLDIGDSSAQFKNGYFGGTVTANAFSGDGSALTGVGGGITEADQWRLTTSFTGDASPISSNLSRVNTDGFGYIGTGMSQSSGIFTFPSTGIWLIKAVARFHRNDDSGSRFNECKIETTTNNSTYDVATNSSQIINIPYQTGETNSYGEFIFDVTSTSTHKVRFSIDVHTTVTTVGNTGQNLTYFTFIRLGDT